MGTTSHSNEDTGMDSPVDLYVNKASGKMYIVYAQVTPLIYFVRLSDFEKYKLAFDIFNQKYRKASADEITRNAALIKKFAHRIRKLTEEHKESTATASTSQKGKCPFIRIEATSELDTLDRLIVSDEVRESMIKCANFVLNGSKIEKHWKMTELTRRAMTRRINFYGPPGTGKTSAARVLARMTNKKLAVVDGTSLNSIYVGGTAHNIQALFEGLKGVGDALVFMDEADDLLLDRDRAGHYEAVVNSSRSSLLVNLDKFEGWMLFATNRFKAYDAAFVRRIGRHVYFPLPDHHQREKIWRVYTRGAADTLDLTALAAQSEGLSGADILMAVTNAIETVSLQPERSTWVLSDELLRDEIEKLASSKAGHRLDGEG